MKDEKHIRKLVENILINAYSITSPGLYNGKAGIALALFEAAKYLNDENIEDKAFELFQEALIRSKNDYSFENGLSGIGYALIYLINNKFIDADFNDIFSEQSEKIIKEFENIDKYPNRILCSLKIIYFLSVLRNVHKEDARPNIIIEKVFQGVELYLSLQFLDWKNISYTNNKAIVLQTFETYLELVDYSEYNNFSNYLINSYSELYRIGRVGSSFTIGYYLNKINKRNDITQYSVVINGNLINGIKNVHLNTFSLEERINIGRIAKSYLNIKLYEENIKNIKRLIRLNCPQYGYQYGLSRYLIYYLNKDEILI